MELPDELKGLYKHWSVHAQHQAEPVEITNFANASLLSDILWLIQERMAIWERKILGESPPFTSDPILSKYRFCNIYRELDRQTIEFHTLLNSYRDDFSLWLLNMFFCRMVARPKTIQQVGLLNFSEENNKKVYQRLLELEKPKYGTPYVFPISVIQKSPFPTREQFLCFYLPLVIPLVAQEIQRWQNFSVFSAVKKILPIFKFKLQFLWTEVLIDTAYQYPEKLDLFSKFPIGPGAISTLQKIDSNMDPSVLAVKLSRIPINTNLTHNGAVLHLSAENWEGIACEYRKYSNLKQNKGRKRLFKSVQLKSAKVLQ